ncbi:MAG: flagellin, partial [Pyrinomonadaceae bacterium]
MPFRVTDTANSQRLAAQIAASQQRLQVAHEQVASGKRINRPSDDPRGAGSVLRLRSTQVGLEQFRRSAGVAQDQLLAADETLDVYERALDRVRGLLTQAATGTADPAIKQAVATELDGLRAQVLGLANQNFGDRYLFGGTRHDAPPYDSTSAA